MKKIINSRKIFLLSIILIFKGLSAEVPFGGEQSGLFDSATYVINKDLVVAKDSSMSFIPGGKLKFMPSTGIKVYGNLKMEKMKLVSYDSVKGIWNGVEVSGSGTIEFGDIEITHSVIGLSVKDSASIKKLERVVFEDNDVSLKIGDVEIKVREGLPFTFSNENIKVTLSESVEKPVVENGKDNSLKTIMRISSAVGIVACSALSIYYGINSSIYGSKYDDSETIDEARKYREKCENAQKVSIGTGIAAGVFGISMLVTLSF